MILLFLLTSFTWSEPSLTVDSANTLQLGLPASLLEEKALADNLQSGLTTILRVTCRPKRGGPENAFQLSIRFDLWDEQYLIAETRQDGQSERHQAKETAFETWWQEQRFVITKVQAGESGVWEVDVEVLPFSAIEQQETRAWLARTTGQAANGGADDGVLEAIVTTSIKRKPLQRFRWDVPVQQP